MFETKNFICPRCGALPGRDCRGSRVPSHNTLGGGWGGPPTLSRSHTERVQARKAAEALVGVAR